jgi:hypothetical protein
MARALTKKASRIELDDAVAIRANTPADKFFPQ